MVSPRVTSRWVIWKLHTAKYSTVQQQYREFLNVLKLCVQRLSDSITCAQNVPQKLDYCNSLAGFRHCEIVKLRHSSIRREAVGAHGTEAYLGGPCM